MVHFSFEAFQKAQVDLFHAEISFALKKYVSFALTMLMSCYSRNHLL